MTAAQGQAAEVGRWPEWLKSVVALIAVVAFGVGFYFLLSWGYSIDAANTRDDVRACHQQGGTAHIRADGTFGSCDLPPQVSR